MPLGLWCAAGFEASVRLVVIQVISGGEEFVILMPEAGCSAAGVTAERLRQMVAETPLVKEKQDLSITISLGVACWHGKGALTFDTLLARADEALYQAKENGRNWISVWGES